MFRRLPSVDGYTIDERLREFRKVDWKRGEPSIEFVPFESELGGRLLRKVSGGFRQDERIQGDRAGDVWSQMRKAWREYKAAKARGDSKETRRLSARIRALQEVLGVPSPEAGKAQKPGDPPTVNADPTVFVFARWWEAVIDGVTLHATRQEAEAAFKDYAGVSYARSKRSEYEGRKWSGSIIEELTLAPDLGVVTGIQGQRAPKMSYWCTDEECDFASPDAWKAKEHQDIKADANTKHIIAVDFGAQTGDRS